MDNVRDIRKKKNLYYILPEDISYGIDCEILKRAAIFVCLYYVDTLEGYFSYFDHVPKEMSVYIVSSNPQVWEKVLLYRQKSGKSTICLIKKENRGRDISALLVACRAIIKRYEYICFIHDKKSNRNYLERDTEKWISNMWGNCLSTESYIKNILHLFVTEQKIGLLVPPEPMGDYYNLWYANNAWGNDFENTKELAEMLQLECNIVKELSPITLGTVFWGKVSALKKLFDREWKYDDFGQEPLPEDGTLSHAIERILSYVAQDAGYDTGTVMTDVYAREQMVFLQENMEIAFQIMKKELGIANIDELKKFERKKERIFDFCEKNQRFYLYGAGKRGLDCLHFLRWNGYRPEKFIVSRRDDKTANEIEGISIIEWDEIDNVQEIGIIITVRYELQKEIIQKFKARKFSNYIKYID